MDSFHCEQHNTQSSPLHLLGLNKFFARNEIIFTYHYPESRVIYLLKKKKNNYRDYKEPASFKVFIGHMFGTSN